MGEHENKPTGPDEEPTPEESAAENLEEGFVGDEEKALVASQWQLIWWKFRRHRLAMISAGVLIIIYTLAIFCEFFAPYDPTERDIMLTHAPPQRIRFFDQEGNFHLRPFVYGFERERDPETMRIFYEVDKEQKFPLQLLHRGEPYELWGQFETDLHLFGVEEGHVFLLGTDRLGRDMLSRILYGARISTSIGLVGVFLSFMLGVVIGGFAGYIGGIFDSIAMRIIEIVRSIPTIPLWMGLSAALPPHWPQIWVYFGITVILSLIGWTQLARVVRSRFLSLREQDFVTAARLAGANEWRIIVRHMVPSFSSYIIAAITLAIPQMIIGETSLSFLGLGLQPPAISWGVLLQEAQNIRTVALSPWLLLPGLMVIITVLAFNFLGDGLRDAADPYSR